MLCKSMQAFLEPCKVVIIYDTNSEEVNSGLNVLLQDRCDYFEKFNAKKYEPKEIEKYKLWTDWFLAVKELLLEKFSVKTYCGIDVSCEDASVYITQDGWAKQQPLKLLASYLVNTPEYVVLDSKNFFLTKCSLDDIYRPLTNKTLYSINAWKDGVLNFVEHVCDFLNFEYTHLDKMLTKGWHTPYIIRKDICRQLIKEWPNSNTFYKWMVDANDNTNFVISEFLLYEIYEKKLNINDVGKHLEYADCTVWKNVVQDYKTPRKIAEYIKKEKNNEILISGFHRKIDSMLSLNDINEILNICDLEFIMPQTVGSPFNYSLA